MGRPLVFKNLAGIGQDRDTYTSLPYALPDGSAAKRAEYVSVPDVLGIMPLWFRVTSTALYESETSLYVREAEE